MNIDSIKSLIESIPDNPELQLFAVRQSSKGQLPYSAIIVPFSNYGDLHDYAKKIVEFCTTGRNAPLVGIERIRKFDGSTMENRWSCIGTADEKISETWKTFVAQVDTEHREESIAKLKPNAVVLTSIQRDFYLVMRQHPVLNFQQRQILWGRKEFKRIPDDEVLLALSPCVDAVCLNDEIVFFTDDGIRFFFGDEEIKKAALKVASKMKACKWISDFDSFEKAIAVPRNALNLLSVSDVRLGKLSSKILRERIAKTFGLKYGNNKFATTERVDIARLIKVLGKRGLLDIVEDVPVEVTSSDKWE